MAHARGTPHLTVTPVPDSGTEDLAGWPEGWRLSSRKGSTRTSSSTRSPEGCPAGYTLQLSEASALLVWCRDSVEDGDVVVTGLR
jgi:hypothetical protein